MARAADDAPINNKMNPEFRQTLNTLTHNFEAANQSAQENIYTFTQLYIDPCLGGIKSCLVDCTAPCFPNREDSLRRKRGQPRGRAEFNFDFYDDWDDDQDAGHSAVAWGNDELDSLLAGRGGGTGQPRRQRAMSYGSRSRRRPGYVEGDPEQGPTAIPSSSYFGFLERLPFKIGAKVLRYKPSAADLQDHPGRLSIDEAMPLVDENVEVPSYQRGHGRQRSGTATSGSTISALSSRGDLIMSDEEDDAQPLDDEFAVALSRRMTNTDDQNNGKGPGKRPSASRRSTRTVSSRSARSQTQRSASQKSLGPVSPTSVDQSPEPPTMEQLHREEENARQEEEFEIEQKREVAHRLALTRGFSSTAEFKPEAADDVSMMAVISPRPASPDSRITSDTRDSDPVQTDNTDLPPPPAPHTRPP